ncbi:predicted protein [Chaetomium globosum CBS 148.51]|uniref:Uncharacterized protein n=1 Tax=Chaetomium globosum (strain ATCC 6205 / CBS 148.51 / DSM 1962 / NBRC 6347 / NRRL 1970) TaxID=306901 RepID=Q2GTE7_CHAGB|nr:uncharacterized protein CHGG_08757 [Chaetomium globosum CBS 148.51]EAQ84743.1 predicted protein [Chaetomium globosum CBS 148.51]
MPTFRQQRQTHLRMLEVPDPPSLGRYVCDEIVPRFLDSSYEGEEKAIRKLKTQASMLRIEPSFSTNTRVAAGAGTTSRDGFVDFAEVMKVDTQVNNGKVLAFPKRRE